VLSIADSFDDDGFWFYMLLPYGGSLSVIESVLLRNWCAV
jgi:hypothetical protein